MLEKLHLDPPKDFTGRELMAIRCSMGLSLEEVAFIADLSIAKVRNIEERHDDWRLYAPAAYQIDRITRALHFALMIRHRRKAKLDHDIKGPLYEGCTSLPRMALPDGYPERWRRTEVEKAALGEFLRRVETAEV